uniref:Uncharacterized protein n=1 Tax=Megaselia scalaris TaxID=36166 RepID=T1GXI1_MEGSC
MYLDDQKPKTFDFGGFERENTASIPGQSREVMIKDRPDIKATYTTAATSSRIYR